VTGAGSVTVQVVDGFAVYDGKKQVGGGSQLTVPADVAERWAEAGWVELVDRKAKTGKRT
jgi:hypothetical protein